MSVSQKNHLIKLISEAKKENKSQREEIAKKKLQWPKSAAVQQYKKNFNDYSVEK